jgi:hypothetical protein
MRRDSMVETSLCKRQRRRIWPHFRRGADLAGTDFHLEHDGVDGGLELIDLLTHLTRRRS